MNQHRYFCTLFDQGYLLKGVAMLQSLKEHCPSAQVFVLCMDETTERIVQALQLGFVNCMSLAEIEDETLLAVKANRGTVEYFWTLSPCLPWHVLQQNPDIDLITYLDADLLFYSSVEPLFEEMGTSSIAIIEHRFSPRLMDRVVNGRFCVEWISFRRDDEGMDCLSRWRSQCMEWCHYRLDDGKMGDQKYLDEWPDRYTRCHILMHPGAGIAPWNYSQCTFGSDTDGNITIDGTPLVFYHFHQFQLLANGHFDRVSTFYTSDCREPEAVYAAYELRLQRVLGQVRAVERGFSAGMKPVANVKLRRWAQRFVPRRVKDTLHRIIRY